VRHFEFAGRDRREGDMMTMLSCARTIMLFALAALSSASSLPARAQTYPAGTIHLVVAYAPGGTGDFVARVISDKLAAALGRSVVVDNRPGASGAIGTQSVVSAAPDGHTLLVGQTSEVAINQYWIKGISYDADKDLQPIALATVVPLALVVPADAPYSTMAEFLAALSSPGKSFSFASAGTGTPGHFAGELLKLKARGALTHVPYKGAGPALNDLLGSHVDFYFPGFPAALPLVKAGSLKILAVSSAKRSASAPGVPTVAETSGIADFDFTLWQGFFAPRGTPPELVMRLNREINAVLAQPDVKEKMQEAGADIVPMSVDQFAQFVKAESRKYLQIIKDTGVTPE
jgi:tripartite-type tricarboxylate transporter receptor subunit TctC